MNNSFYENESVIGTGLNDRTKKSLKFILDSKPTKILDVGCGNGEVANIIRSISNAEVYGIDISKKAVELTLKKGIIAKKVDISKDKIPFDDEFFDVVYCGDVIEHLIDPDFALEEIKRVLRHDGTFVLSTPNLAAWYNRILLLLSIQPIFTEVSTKMNVGKKFRFIGQHSQPVGHLRIFTLSSLKDILELYGFEVINIKGAFLKHSYSILVAIDKMLSVIPSLSSGLVVKAVKGKNCNKSCLPKSNKIKCFYDHEGENINQSQKYLYHSTPEESIKTFGAKIRKYWIDSLLNFSSNNNSYFLDVGCAEGLFVMEQADKFKVAIGLDISTPRIRKATKLALNKKNISFILGDASKLPFQDKSCHVVLCSETLEHIPNYVETFSELMRVCEDYLIIAIPNYSLFTQILTSILKIIGLRKDILDYTLSSEGHLHIITPHSLDKVAKKYGYNRKETIYCAGVYSFPFGYLGGFHWNWLSRVSNKKLTTKILHIVSKLDKKLDKISFFKFFASCFILKYEPLLNQSKTKQLNDSYLMTKRGYGRE